MSYSLLINLTLRSPDASRFAIVLPVEAVELVTFNVTSPATPPPVKSVPAVTFVISPTDELSTFCQASVAKSENTAQSPSCQSVIPSKLVPPAFETI